MTALMGGGSGGGGGSAVAPLAVSPGQAAGLIGNMYQDAGLGGLGFSAGANAGGTGVPSPVGSPTPNLQYDMSSAAAAAANQGNLTLDQLALLQGQQSAQQQQGAGFGAGFNTPSSNAPNELGVPASGGGGGDPILT